MISIVWVTYFAFPHTLSAPRLSASAPSSGINELALADLFGVQVIDTNSLIQGGSSVHSAGAHWVHLGIEWRQLAPTISTDVSHYAWSEFDSALSSAANQGFNIIVTLGGNPCWAASFNRGPINRVPLTRWDEYVTAVVERYRMPPYNIRYWAIYNEPDTASYIRSTPDCQGETNAQAYGDHPADYVQILQRSYQLIKGIDSTAIVMQGGLAMDAFVSEGGFFIRDFLTQTLQLGAGNYFDATNFHYYPEYNWRWGDLRGKVNHIRTVMQKHSVTKPIICTELGASSAYQGGTADSQSRAVIKYYTLAAVADVKIGIWYNLNDYSAPNDVYSYHGLLRSDYFPKPSLLAYRNMAQQLQGHRYTRTLAKTEGGATNLEGYVFWNVAGNSEVRILWSADNTNQTVTLPSNVLAVTDKYGVARLYGSTITVDGDPLFIKRSVALRNYFLPITSR
jgi:hypothetical protein